MVGFEHLQKHSLTFFLVVQASTHRFQELQSIHLPFSEARDVFRGGKLQMQEIFGRHIALEMGRSLWQKGLQILN
jgi:hypothetical protein